ncbi:MAG: G5 domain-containing protein [Armatimonadetes bacterium]|nr:G5 domain-containing protein [Armatimonadota bacterium]
MSKPTSIRAAGWPAFCWAAAGLAAALVAASPRAFAFRSDPRSSARSATETKTETIPYISVKKQDPSLGAGSSKTVQTGKPGLAKVTYSVVTEGDAAPIRDEVSRVILRKPVAEVIKEGSRPTYALRGRLASRGGIGGRRAYQMTATGYSAHGGPGIGSRGSSGLPAGFSMVAVDPRIIPMGTRLYIEGYGYAVAGDTGSAIRGLRIDLGQDSLNGARRVGRRHVVVHVLD